MLQKTSQKGKEGHGGSKFLVEQGCFIHVCMSYILLYKEALGKKLGKEQKTRRITTVTKGITRNNNRHKARRQSIT